MGGFNGFYAEVPAPRLGSEAIRAALTRSKAPLDKVDEVYLGNVISAGLGQSVARQAGLGAGLPPACGATTVNKMCGSAMRAIMFADQAIRTGDASLVIAGGTENMTRAPYLLQKGRSGYRLGHGEILDAMIRDGLTDAYTGRHMADYAEAVAQEYGFTREMQDDYAIASFKRALAAHAAGHLSAILAPVEVETRKGKVLCDHDEEPAKFVEEKFRTLKPAFDPKGTITAGNASAISDGAAAVVVASEAFARQNGIVPQARLIGHATASLEPARFPVAPSAAIRKLCDRLSWKLAEVDAFEINEAFACVPLSAMKDLGIPHEKLNAFGGAIAIGHPIGASGARIVATLIAVLKARGGRRGIASLCIGGGEATALAIELI